MAEDANRLWKDQYMLRLPDGMRERIKAAAEANNRSMNAEIVARLMSSLGQTDLDKERRALADTLGSLMDPDGPANVARGLNALNERLTELEHSSDKFMEAIIHRLDRLLAEREKSSGRGRG